MPPPPPPPSHPPLAAAPSVPSELRGMRGPPCAQLQTRRRPPMLRVAAAAQLAALAVLVMVPAQALPCSAGLRHAAPRGELAPPLRGAANATAPEDEHPGHSTAALRPRGDEVTRAGPSHVGPRRGTWGASLSSVLGAFVLMAHGARSGRRLEASAAQVSAGSYHSVVLLTDGTVRAFGLGLYGQLGYGSKSTLATLRAGCLRCKAQFRWAARLLP